MPFCDKCGAEVKNNAKFCDKCGNKINAENQATAAQNTNVGINCPKCGSVIPFGNTICLNCGSPLNTVDVESKINKITIIGYTSSILSIIFFVTWFCIWYTPQFFYPLSILLAIIALGSAFYIIFKATKMRIHGGIILLILLTRILLSFIIVQYNLFLY